MNKYLPLPIISFTFLLSFIFFYYMAPPLFSFPDVFWHIAAGRLIREEGWIPVNDSWSFTGNGEYIWYNISWLYDIIISYVTDIFGELGLFYFEVVLCSLSVCLIFVSCYGRKVSIEAALIVTALVALVLYLRVTGRPHVVSFLMIPIFHLLAHNARENTKILYWMIPLMVFWANMHGGIMVGFTILGAYAVEAFIKRKDNYLKDAVIVTILCLLVIQLNPAGPGIFEAISRTTGSVINAYIIEWKSVRLFDHMGVTIYTLAFILATNIQNREIPIADKILTFGWLILGLYSIRLFVIFVLLSAPYIAMSLNAFKHDQNPEFRKMCTDANKKLQALILSLILLITFSYASPTLIKREGRIYGPLNIAREIQYILKNYPDVNFINFYDYGAEIIYYSNGKKKIFVDGRAETAYPREVVEDYIGLLVRSKPLDKIAAKYNANGIIAPKHDTLAQLARENQNWKLVKSSEKVEIFIKQK